MIDLTTIKASDLIPVIEHPLLKHSSRSAIYSWLRSGELDSVRIGSKWLSTDEAITNFMAKCSGGPQISPGKRLKRLAEVESAEAQFANRRQPERKDAR